VVESGLYARLKRSGVEVSDGKIKSDTESTVDKLSLEAGRDTVPECLGALVSRDSLHSSNES